MRRVKCHVCLEPQDVVVNMQLPCHGIGETLKLCLSCEREVEHRLRNMIERLKENKMADKVMRHDRRRP